jgi:hypothetical protein
VTGGSAYPNISSAVFPEPPMPFEMTFISANISVSHGCRQRFPRKSDGTIIGVPYNVVIRHQENRSFTDPSGKLKSKRGNAYYHVFNDRTSNECKSKLIIEQKIILKYQNKELIYCNLGLHLP